MVELAILRKPLQDLKLAEADLSPQVFDKIAGYVEKEQMESAIGMIQEALEEGNFDMRLISYYFYADFLKLGIKSFQATFPMFMNLVKDHWDILRPLHRKEKQIESSFNWFFTHVINKLKYNERLKNENKAQIWPSHMLQLSQQEFEQLQETVTHFRHFFYDRWSQSSVKERITHLLKRIADLKLVMEQQKAVDEPIKNVVEPVSEPLIAKLEEKPVSRDPSPLETPEMMNLIKKLETFEALTQKEMFLKAALVSADITQAIGNFDPCAYFPKLFSTYFKLLARHSSLIAEQAENQESLEWKALERLYKADIDQFIEW